MSIPFYHPKPAPFDNRNGTVIPEVKANPFSRLTFGWIFPLLKVGYSRPIEKEDVWRLDDKRLTASISSRLEQNFFSRVPPSKRPLHLGGTSTQPSPSRQDANRSDSSSSTEVGDDDDRVVPSKASKGVEIQYDLDSPKTYKEEAEQEVLTEMAPEAVIQDAPMVSRTFSLGENATGHGLGKKSEHAPAAAPTSTSKAGSGFNPLNHFKRAKKVANGSLIVEKDENGVERYYDSSLAVALLQTIWWKLLVALLFKVCGSVISVTSSLVTRRLISYITDAHTWHQATEAERANLSTPSSIGTGIGLAIGLAAMQEAASLFNNHYFAQSMQCGFYMRASLIDQISRKSLRLSPKARITETNGRLTTAVSGDCSFLDWAAPMFIEVIVEPLTIIIGFALLIYNLGYSALVGVAVLLASTPIMAFLFGRLIGSRQAQMKLVDSRVRLLSEVLNAIRQIKLYAYETYFAGRILKYREQELGRLKVNVRNRASMISTMTFLPTLAAVLSFVTYGLSGHNLTPAVIFSAFQLFGIIQGPLRMLPMAFTALSDCYVSVGRLSKILLADELPQEPVVVNPFAKHALRVQGDFTFETAKPPDMKGGPREFGRDRSKAGKAAKKAAKEAKKREKKGLPPIEDEKKKKEEEEEGEPFTLKDIDLTIPRGAFVCIVGRIGSGKSALLQAMIGEMRKTTGTVEFGGSVSYVSQQPWIQNASVKDNIVFGEDAVDSGKLANAVETCALTRDLEILGDGLDTEIGERGITLSGGQKARVSLARSVYFDADIALLDSPLAAVDSHVSAFLIEHCLLGQKALGNKTRILVTHHLEVLPDADLILVMEEGKIVQQGTYPELMASAGVFQSLIEEYGNEEDSEEKQADEKKPDEKKEGDDAAKGPVVKLMMDEERNTGSVSWAVYIAYGKAMGKEGWVFIALAFLVLAQASQVLNTLFLGFWSGQTIPGFAQGQYMGLYAAFGASQTLCTFLGSFTMFLAGIRASFILFDGALTGVLRSPISFHDRTPIGRIISRLSKDVEMVDDRLTFQWYQFLSSILGVLGTIALVFYTYAYLGILFVPLIAMYSFFAAFYRKTSREVKRLDSTTRSYIYSSFGEQLTGMATIRAYRQQSRFRSKLQLAVDDECRFYFITIILQRWLGVRLDVLGSCLILGIGLFGVGFRNTVSPSKLGVVLTYSLQTTQIFSQIVNIGAQLEQEMNTTERILHYASLPSEAPARVSNDPPKSWPERGAISFKNVVMRYRPELPLVLKGISFEAAGGEKIGIVGRTGAGKSSLAQTLFRIVEVESGSIEIDGYNLRNVGLDTLRTQLSALPQDTLLYSGTMRQNLDPTGSMTDAALHDTMRRCGLVATDEDRVTGRDLERLKKFQLDAVVADEGGNFSGGERQLVALARALVKNSRVLLLDEATSSVDPETDAMIQKCIRKEFGDVTLLCIAHRLATIAFYDKVMVMDAGQVAEFDTPLNLFDKEDSIFRSMCDAAKLTRAGIERIRAGDIVVETETIEERIE